MVSRLGYKGTPLSLASIERDRATKTDFGGRRIEVTISAGSEIDAWCTSCRMTLNHRVVAMVRGAAKRVLCLTCNKQHNYRAPKGDGSASAPAEKAAVSAGTGRAAKKPAASKAGGGNAREWQLNVANKDSTDFLPYSIHKTFEVGQLVNHPKFGEGYVKEAITSQKLCVLFRDGPRTLIHGVPA